MESFHPSGSQFTHVDYHYIGIVEHYPYSTGTHAKQENQLEAK